MRNSAKPKAGRIKRTHPMYSSTPNESRLSDLLKEVSQFEEFKATILPAMQKDLKKGMGAKELRAKYAALLQARVITDALTTKDAGKAALIAKDLLDRVEGKATEKKEVVHKFQDMKDEEIDAVLKSEIEELEDMEQRFQN